MAERPKMPREERAKQFMPFAALKGYPEALHKKEKRIVPRMELSEEYGEELDRKLRRVRKNDMITVIYFCKHEYLKKTGVVSRVDTEARELSIVNTKVLFDDIYDIRFDRRNTAYEPDI